jgi:hypothetical protein
MQALAATLTTSHGRRCLEPSALTLLRYPRATLQHDAAAGMVPRTACGARPKGLHGGHPR